MGVSHRSFLPVAIIVLATSSPASPGQASRPIGWRSFFEERLLDRAPVIVRARYDRDSTFGDVQLTAFSVRRELRGHPGSRVLVVAAGAVVDSFRDVDRLLFLKPEAQDQMYRLVDVVDLTDAAEETEATVNGYVGLTEESDPAKRRRILRRLVNDGFGAKGTFSRRLAVREFERLFERFPDTLTDEDLTAAQQALPGLDQADRTRMRTALERLEERMLGDFAGTQMAVPAGPDRGTFIRAVCRLRETTDAAEQAEIIDRTAEGLGLKSVPFLIRCLRVPALQTRAMRHLGDMRGSSAVPELLKQLSTSATDQRARIVECLGRIGDDAATLPVARLLESAPEMFRPVIEALARIGSPAAEGLLDVLAHRLADTSDTDPRKQVITEVRTPEWRATEEKRRAAASRAYSR